MSDGVRRIASADRVADDPISGQTREFAVSTDRMWCGVVRARGSEVTPWHHHGAYATVAYVTAGLKRLEFGAVGSDVVEGAPGDFLFIPPGVVHRESNPGEEATETIAFRVGSGATTIGAEGPSDGSPVRRITPADREQGDPTPGMVREEAAAGEGFWSGFVRTATGSVSGWHHHGDHQSVIYVLAGAMRIDSGSAGQGTVDLGPGDFCFIPPGIVHRESNPGDVESNVVVVRAGNGPPTTNVEGP
ncbi:MAG: cupin domain-containing protein [Actinomycetota bacterium]